MARTFLGIIVGAVVMWLAIMCLEFAGHALFPPPPGLNPQNPDDLIKIISQASVGAMGMLVVAWVAGAFAGGFVAAKVARPHPHGAAVTIALLVMAGVGGMIYLVPDHPIWVSALGLILPIPAALVAARLACRLRKSV